MIAAEGTFSAEAVAARAAVSPATFYVYFPSKDAALAAAFDLVLAELNERAGAELEIEGLLDRDLGAVARALAAAVVGVLRDSALVFRLAVARLPESRVIREVYRKRQDEGLRILRRFVELGAAAGRIRDDCPDTVAAALLVTLQGYNNPLLLGPRAPRAVRDELAKMLVRLLEP